MNHSGHLSSRDISRLLVEGTSSDLHGHAENCPSCQAKLDEAGAPLAAFRNAVIGWSEEQRSVKEDRGVQLRPLSDAGRQRFFGWIPAMSFSLGMALLLAIFMQSGGWKMLSMHPATENHVSDAALMEQVDQEVSEAVPDSMSPLTDLVGWDGEGSDQASSKDQQSAGKVSATHAKKNLVD